MSTDAAHLLEELDRRQNELMDSLEDLDQRIEKAIQAWNEDEADEELPAEQSAEESAGA